MMVYLGGIMPTDNYLHRIKDGPGLRLQPGRHISRPSRLAPRQKRQVSKTTLQGLGITLAAIVALGVILVVALALCQGREQRAKEASIRAELYSQESQFARLILIQKFIQQRVFVKVVQKPWGAEVWVSRTFNLLTFDEKSTLLSVPYLYYCGSRDFGSIEVRDEMNGRTLGTFGPGGLEWS
jgi:hypothetical protein